MSWGVHPADLADARDQLTERVAEHPTSHALEQLARAHVWLGERDAARRRYREAADVEQANLRRWKREDPTRVARIGSLLFRAGEPGAARPWLERALGVEVRDDRLAGLRYLLGDDATAIAHAARAAADKDVPYPLADAIATLARARRDADPALADDARERFADLIRAERTPPDEESGSGDLALFDWLEEAYRVQAALTAARPPGGRVMLERSGLLAAERAPARPAAAGDTAPEGPGSRTVVNPHPDGGEVEATVTVDEHGDLEFLLDPDRDLRAAIRQSDGGWHAWMGGTQLPGEYHGPRSAKRALREPLRAQPHGQWAVALLDRLFTEGFKL
jgi:tetratricopeptide (TPR) repeat protein